MKKILLSLGAICVLLIALIVMLTALLTPANAPAPEQTVQTTAETTVETTAETTAPTEETQPVRTDLAAHHGDIQAAIEAAAKKYGATGVQVAVVERGKVADTFAYGWATKNTDPMTPDHKMRVASISKVAVGISAMLLQETGVVDLDQDISQYWGITVKNPAYPKVPITLRTFMTHTSTLSAYSDETPTTPDAIRPKLAGTGFHGSRPGAVESWFYNNYAFRVLGVTLERAAGMTLDQLLQKRLFQHMDIDGAFGGGDIKNTHKLATVYRANGDVGLSVSAQQGRHAPKTPGANGTYFAGGLTISATDLGKLVALLANRGVYNGKRLMGYQSVQEMFVKMDDPLPDGSYQALPMFFADDLYGQEQLYFHTGSAYGVYNCMSLDPSTGSGVVVLTSGAVGSTARYDIYNICNEINAYIYALIP